MATQKTHQPRKQKTTPKAAKTVQAATMRRDWRVYCCYALAIAWAVVAVKAYLTVFATSTSSPSVEPHPLVDSATTPVPSFYPMLLASLILLVPVTMCILSISLIRFARWQRIILGLQVLVVVSILLYVQAMAIWHNSLQSFEPLPQARSLDDSIVRRLQCGDAVRMVDSYTFGAKTFYELKDQGYKLKATYDSPTGMLDSEAACDTYYSVRSQHPGDHIILQLFTYNDHNTPAPYLYKYAGQTNVGYGIFVKE